MRLGAGWQCSWATVGTTLLRLKLLARTPELGCCGADSPTTIWALEL